MVLNNNTQVLKEQFLSNISAHSCLHSFPKRSTHIGEGPAGADGVVVAHPALVVWILSSGQDVLVTGVVGLLIEHPAAALHLDGVAAAEVGVHVRAVGVALIRAALEVSVLVKCDLSPGGEQSPSILSCSRSNSGRENVIHEAPSYLTTHPAGSAGASHL